MEDTSKLERERAAAALVAAANEEIDQLFSEAESREIIE